MRFSVLVGLGPWSVDLWLGYWVSGGGTKLSRSGFDEGTGIRRRGEGKGKGAFCGISETRHERKAGKTGYWLGPRRGTSGRTVPLHSYTLSLEKLL